MSMLRALVDIAVGDRKRETLRIDLDSFDYEHVHAFTKALHQGHRALKSVTLTGKIHRVFPPPAKNAPLVRNGERTGPSRGTFCDVAELLADYGALESFTLYSELSIGVRLATLVSEIERVVRGNSSLGLLSLQLTGHRVEPLPLSSAFIAALGASTALRLLLIRNVNIGDDDGAKLVRAVAALPSLHLIDLRGNSQLHTATANALTDVLCESGIGNHIDTICVSGCSFTSEHVLGMIGALKFVMVESDKRKRLPMALRTLEIGSFSRSAYPTPDSDPIEAAVPIVYRYIDLELDMEPSFPLQASRYINLCLANEHTRQKFDHAPPLGDGQEAGGAGVFAALPNELICAIAERVYPTRSLIEMAWTCGLLRSCVNNYVAYLRTGVSDWRILYRDAFLSVFKKRQVHFTGSRHKRMRFTWQ